MGHFLSAWIQIHAHLDLDPQHCTAKTLHRKIANRYSQKWNRSASFPILISLVLILSRSQIHECGNWEGGRTASFLGIHKSDLVCSVVYINPLNTCSVGWERTACPSSLNDTWMWKLGTRPRSFISGNTSIGSCLQCCLHKPSKYMYCRMRKDGLSFIPQR